MRDKINEYLAMGSVCIISYHSTIGAVLCRLVEVEVQTFCLTRHCALVAECVQQKMTCNIVTA